MRLNSRLGNALIVAGVLIGTVPALAQTPRVTQPVLRAPVSESPAAGVQQLPLIAHATFFSQETKRAQVIDPQVFVADPAAAEGTGPQNIPHFAGVRNLRTDDVPAIVVVNAEGQSLGFTAEKWLAAHGTAEVAAQPNGVDRVTITATKLIGFGIYSVFEVTFGADGTTFRPIDGDGLTSSFTAEQDGAKTIVVNATHHLTHANAIVLVYHSDDLEHGVSRGTIGVTAHHHLIVRIP